jgi:hypothetical protein
MKGKVFFLLLILFYTGNVNASETDTTTVNTQQLIKVLRKKALKDAAWAMQQEPVTVTASHSNRSAGDIHDFFSEADYFWPNPASIDSPYVQKDGLSNPDNFVAHREAMIRFSKIIGSLASAYLLTNDDIYVRHAVKHCKAWFADSATYMHPSLYFAQAIKGRTTGRSWGIIDMIQMMEVAQGLYVMQHSKAIHQKDLQSFKNWFQQFLQWMTTYSAGIEEMNAKNNHGTCWVMQVAVFAKFADNKALIDVCRNRFKTILLPNQMAEDGSFPLELKRTKPYGYSIFNLDAMATVCQVLSTKENDLWNFTLADGRNMQKAVQFLYPFIQQKSSWPYQKDIMYWDEWPVAQPSILFTALKFQNNTWFKTWKEGNHSPENKEVIRNLPVRNPLIWMDVTKK